MPTEIEVREALGSILAHLHFTSIERSILFIVADGKPHAVKDMVLPCLKDDQADKNNLSDHITNIRKKINPLGHDILCVYRYRRTHYQYVALLSTIV